MKKTVIIERNNRGRHSAYCADKQFGILGEGNTVEATIEDFMAGVEEMKEVFKEEGRVFPEMEFCHFLI
jgi:hypothetical protein